MMISDGMVEMQRYAFVFGVLCVLCMLFDMVPLLTSLDGRSEVTYQPVSRSNTKSGFSVMYTAIVKTTPMFDSSQGFMYNATSAVMVLAPLTMLFGAYLSFHAHSEIQRATGGAWDDEWMGGFLGGGWTPRRPRCSPRPRRKEDRRYPACTPPPRDPGRPPRPTWWRRTS